MARKTITQPDDWWFRWEVAAFKKGMHLSEWIGLCCNANLDEETQKKLTVRTERGRPSSLIDMSVVDGQNQAPKKDAEPD